MTKKRFVIVSLINIFIAVLLTAILCLKNEGIYHTQYTTFSHTELSAEEIEPLKDLLPGGNIEQTFISEEDTITDIQLSFVTFGRRNTCSVDVELWDEESGKKCDEWKLDARYFPCITSFDVYKNLKLPTPLTKSKGRKYKVIISSNDSMIDNSVTLFYDKNGDYSDGVLKQNGEVLNGNIKLNVIYDKAIHTEIDNKMSIIYLGITVWLIIEMLFLFVVYARRIITCLYEFLKSGVDAFARNIKRNLFILIGNIVIGIVFGFLFQKVRNAPDKSIFSIYIFAFTFVFMTVGCYLIMVYKNQTIKIEKIFLVIALSAGMYLAVFQPKTTLVSWDDEIHYENVVKMSYVSNYRISNADQYMIKRILAKNFQMSTIKEDNQMLNSLYYGAENVYSKNPKVYANVYNMVGYIPAAVTQAIGRAVHLPFTWIFVLGRMSNLLVYTLLVYFGMKRLRSGKWIVFTIALFPTSLFLTCNYSYDYWVICWTIFALCYLFGLAQNIEQKVKYKDYAIILGSFFVGLGPKAIYFPMILFTLMLKSKRHESKKQMWICKSATVLTMLLVISTFMLSFITVGPGTGDSRGGGDVNSALQVQFILQNPVEYTKILLRFLFGTYLRIENSGDYTNLMAYLGKGLFGGISILTLGIAMLVDRQKEKTLNWKIRSFVITILFGTVSLVATALYVSFTPVGYDTVNGCQLRYLLPLIFPFAYVIGEERLANRIRNKINVKYMELLISGMVFFVLYAALFIRLARYFY